MGPVAPAAPRIILDPGVRRSDGGRALVGGSPLRVLRLSERGATTLDALLAGPGTPLSPAVQKLLGRLLATGIVHPVPSTAQLQLADVAVVIPHRDHPDALAALLDQLPIDQFADVTVVDDASPRRLILDHPAVRVIPRSVSGGPGVARQQGWPTSSADILLFVDADVDVSNADWRALLAHFDDPNVAAVAPRVGSARGATVLEVYEAERSPLDLGPTPANVRPRTRVSYVPTATLMVRRAALENVGGFDRGLRVGEDVDLIWRLAAAGHTVRYEPSVEVFHQPRTSWPALARQRYAYGSSAALLAKRHPEAITPFEASPYSAAAWALAVVGGRWGTAAGLATAAASTVALAPKLKGRVPDPWSEAVRLAGKGNMYVGLLSAEATRRAWMPLALVGSVASHRLRRATLAAAVVPPLWEWLRDRPRLDPVRWVAARNLDDAAYCAGVWKGMAAKRSLAAIRPRFPGLGQLLPRRDS